MANPREFDALINEAVEHPIQGWDFRWLTGGGRLVETPLPWSYSRIVRRSIRESRSLLDLGTGGGELLSTLGPFPPRTVATESYPPNVSVAARRLGPLGIQVVQTSGAIDNVEQRDSDVQGRLPFRDESFQLIIDRNEAFVANEVGRVLEDEGRFVTEQTGGSEHPALRQLLELPALSPEEPAWSLGLASKQLSRAGLKVAESAEAGWEITFRDVGALTWYLLAVPWMASGFSVEGQRSRLKELHERFTQGEVIRIPMNGFWLAAVKPA